MTGWKSVFKPGASRSRRTWAAWVVGALLAALLSLVTGERTRNMLFDAWQRTSPRDLSASDVRIVMIDGESLKAIGPWPWPRYYLARLTEEIAADGATVIGFDMLFPEPDRIRPDLFVQFYPELSAQAAREVNQLQPMDRLFGEVIGLSPVVLARAGSGAGPGTGRSAPVEASIAGPLPPELDAWPAIITSIPDLDEPARGHGLINGQPDLDGVSRTVPIIGRVGGRTMPGLALEMARIRLGADAIRTSPSDVTVAGHIVPVDRRGRMPLRFGHFPTSAIISAEDVIGRTVPPGTFANKTVLVGLAAEGTADIVATPLAGEEFGLLVQGQAIDAILNDGWLKRPGWTGPAEWAAAALLAVLALLLAGRRRGARLLLMLAFAALPVASWLLFREAATLFDPVRPALIGGGALAGAVVGLFGEARRERERLRDALVQERIASAAAEGELQAARAIQLGMVPPRRDLAAIDPRIDVDALLEPAKSVGGDLYDCLRTGPDSIGFAIGDVTGKGVPAALFMAMSKALLSSALLREQGALDKAAEAINRDLLRSNEEVMSVTMILGQIALASGTVTLVCAGHEDPYVVGADRSIRRLDLAGGPPLSTVEFDYPVETLSLKKGETLLLVTDGITEAQDAADALYGRDRMVGLLANVEPAATAICETIRDDVRRFEGQADATDDLTVMALRYLGPQD
jgi:serine phosphatase RsbU (regulator of sigma subunit)/CHASE2 domain-containing sensor protein